VETANAFNAFLSMQPGNAYANVRTRSRGGGPVISSGNLSHVIPLSSIWSGMAHNDWTNVSISSEVQYSNNQGTGIYFFSVKIPLKAACFEEKIHRQVEEGREKGTESKNSFDFFDFVVKISSKTWWFSGT
jgi:hypothetical protein